MPPPMKYVKATTRSGAILLMLGVNAIEQNGELHFPRKSSFSSHYNSSPWHNVRHSIWLVTTLGR